MVLKNFIKNQTMKQAIKTNCSLCWFKMFSDTLP